MTGRRWLSSGAGSRCQGAADRLLPLRRFASRLTDELMPRFEINPHLGMSEPHTLMRTRSFSRGVVRLEAIG
jgi:hypothetical protein